MQVNHYHIIGALAGAAALIAYLNSPSAQRVTMQYLGMIENGIIRLAYTLRHTARNVSPTQQMNIRPGVTVRWTLPE